MRNEPGFMSRIAPAAAAWLIVIALGSCAPTRREEPAPSASPPPAVAPKAEPVVTPPPVAAPVTDDKARLEEEARQRAEREAKARAAAKAEAERRRAAARRAAAVKAAREAAAKEAAKAAAAAEAEKKVEPPPPPPPPPKANLARYVPVKMMQGVASPVDLWADHKLGEAPLKAALLAFARDREQRAAQQQKAKGEMPQPRDVGGAQGEIVDGIEAELVVDKTQFAIVPERGQRQNFRGRDSLRWNWLVTPTEPGEHSLTFRVRRIDATGTTEETFTDTVEVEAKPKSIWERITELDNWIKGVIGLGIALVLALVWRQLRTRRD